MPSAIANLSLLLYGVEHGPLSNVTSRDTPEASSTADFANDGPGCMDAKGFELRAQVYAFNRAGTEGSPARLSDAYAVNAREISDERAALAGHRLAEFLNQKLR